MQRETAGSWSTKAVCADSSEIIFIFLQLAKFCIDFYIVARICLRKKINSSKAKNLQSGNSAVGCIFSKCVQYEHFWMEMGGFARDCMGVATYDISCNGQWLFVGPWKAT
jgi:hypothetical protein